MAYFAVVHTFPGATKAQYEASLAAVHPGDGLPAGQLYHAAGPSAGGWTIVALHDSEASWVAFRDNTLMPALAKGVPGGFTGPPQEITFEVDTLRRAPAAT